MPAWKYEDSEILAIRCGRVFVSLEPYHVMNVDKDGNVEVDVCLINEKGRVIDGGYILRLFVNTEGKLQMHRHDGVTKTYVATTEDTGVIKEVNYWE